MAAVIPNAAHPAGSRRPGTPLLALAAGGLFGVVQTLLAQRFGLLRFDAGQSDSWSIELATLTWLSALSVVVGVLVAGRLGESRRPPDRPRRQDPFAIAAAVLGSLLAVPLTTSSAAWAALYGGATPTWQTAVPVLLGVALGAVAGLVCQRSRPVAVGLAVGSIVIWSTAVLSVLLDPDRAPVLGHPDLGFGSAVRGPQLGALVLALLYGAVVGVTWGTRRVQSRVTAALAGPALVAAAFLVAVPIAGPVWLWSPIPTALLAIPCAGFAALVSGWAADRRRRHHD